MFSRGSRSGLSRFAEAGSSREGGSVCMVGEVLSMLGKACSLGVLEWLGVLTIGGLGAWRLSIGAGLV